MKILQSLWIRFPDREGLKRRNEMGERIEEEETDSSEAIMYIK